MVTLTHGRPQGLTCYENAIHEDCSNDNSDWVY